MTPSQNIKNKDTIELRSEEVQEIMGHTPRWIIRWGISLIVIILVGILVGSWFFKYPDVIPATVVVTTENPPAAVVAKTNGKIDSLLVQDMQIVSAGEILAVIENPASFDDVIAFRNQVVRLEPFLLQFDTSMAVPFRGDLSLGNIQTHYTGFLKDYANYLNFIKLDYHLKKIQSVREEIGKYKIYYNRLYRQRNLLQREVELAEKQFARDSTLFAQGVIPPAEFEQAESRMIRKDHDFEQSRIHLSETAITMSELEKEILDLQLRQKEDKNRLEALLFESYNNLNASVAAWEQIYLLRAPQDGIVSFTKFWSVDQNVALGDIVLTIVPESTGRIIGRVDLPQRRAGKVKPEQSVNIKLDNYPYMEFGMVKGIVDNISLVPTDNNLTVQISLPDGLQTNYGIELNFSQEMLGQAEIITEARPLLIRILEPFRYVYEKNIRSGEISE